MKERRATAGELWDHVEWLVRRDGFFELKRAAPCPDALHSIMSEEVVGG
jgi:hypothetical protein